MIQLPPRRQHRLQRDLAPLAHTIVIVQAALIPRPRHLPRGMHAFLRVIAHGVALDVGLRAPRPFGYRLRFGQSAGEPRADGGGDEGDEHVVALEEGGEHGEAGYDDGKAEFERHCGLGLAG